MDMSAIPENIKAFVLFVANHESMHAQLQIKELERRIKALEAPKDDEPHYNCPLCGSRHREE